MCHSLDSFLLCIFNIFLFHIFKITNLVGGGRNFERLNLERPIFRNFERLNVERPAFRNKIKLPMLKVTKSSYSIFLFTKLFFHIFKLSEIFVFFNLNAPIFYNILNLIFFNFLSFFLISKFFKLSKFVNLIKNLNYENLISFEIVKILEVC